MVSQNYHPRRHFYHCRTFRWKFNNSGETLDVGSARYSSINGTRSVLHYTPVTDQYNQMDPFCTLFVNSTARSNVVCHHFIELFHAKSWESSNR
uniref:Uncharacterized protein n=1 Tax=Phlebotomus papatasi TaxID=29031 RepID=A0A1B0DNE7_PHLPP